MSQQIEEQILNTLQEIRDGQRELIDLMVGQRAAAAEEIRESRISVESSIALQKEGLRRQRTVTYVAVPGILACIAAIAYLVLRYF